ncbi:MAG: histidine phosphatase family protein [Clostridia bacterium]|nr:histidine phosphatase family protein [Clostridia bacterium]
MNDKTLYIIRHGETDMNAELRLQGQVDSRLNENGIREARETARILSGAGIEFAKAYSSPLQRAMNTAEIIAPDLKIIPVPEIMELKFGDYEGLAYSDIGKELWDFIHDPENVNPPETVERIQSLIERTGGFLDRLINGDDSGNILIVAHGIALRSILRNLYGDESGENVWAMPIKNCVVYKVTVIGGKVTGIRRADELSIENKNDKSKVF